MVLALADSATSDGFSTVHSMVDGLQRAQVRENGLEIVIVNLPKEPPRHVGTNLPGSYLAGPHGFQELRFIVVADSGRIGCQICARRL